MNKPKILVVDDIIQNVKLLRVILTASEYDVVEAYNGEEALEKVRAELPDLILLDVMMPKLTGYEVCQRLRADERTRSIPVVMITALHEMDDRVKGIEAGADDFISKPFNKVELLTRVKSLLRLKQAPPARKDETPLLSIILPELNDGIVIADGQGKARHINPAAQKLLNVQGAEVQDFNVFVCLSRMKLSLPPEALKDAPEKTTDFQILPSNGQYPFLTNARMSKLYNEHGGLEDVVFVLKKA